MGIPMIHPPGNQSPDYFGHAFSVAYQHKTRVNQAEGRHVRKKCNNEHAKEERSLDFKSLVLDSSSTHNFY